MNNPNKDPDAKTEERQEHIACIDVESNKVFVNVNCQQKITRELTARGRQPKNNTQTVHQQRTRELMTSKTNALIFDIIVLNKIR